MYRTTGGAANLKRKVSVSNRVQIQANHRTEHDAEAMVSGIVQLILGEKIVRTFPLKFDTKADIAFVDIPWDPSDAEYLGTNIAKFIVKIGSSQFTSTGDFLVTK